MVILLGITLILLYTILANFWYVLLNILNRKFEIRVNVASYLFQNVLQNTFRNICINLQ